MVNAPNKSHYYASHVAGPIFEEIADKVYATSINIHEELKRQSEITSLTHIPVSKNGAQADLFTVFDGLDIPIHSSNPDNKWVITQTGPDIVKMERRAITENLVPNVKGMSAQDAVFILENAGMSVTLKGRGAIREQSIAPGQRIVIGERITLDLS